MTAMTATTIDTAFDSTTRHVTPVRSRIRARLSRMGEAIVRAYGPPADLPVDALPYWHYGY
ncbi:MAG: hypothetical protein JO147_12850 [Actinobacteria bacterium]|nr:hypothetical protein [Actinomycetota bacterium]